MNNQEKEKQWVVVNRKMDKDGLKVSFRENRQYRLAKDQYTATTHDNYLSVALTVRDRIVERWIQTQQAYHKSNAKRVYYLSMEFLIGRLFGTNILNLGLWDETKSALEELGLDLEEVRQQEQDAGLGNGGLGRLAACFLDSMATMNIPAHGYGIRYDYGIFQQKIVKGRQVELPDEWLSKGNPWEFARPEYTIKVKFGGRTYSFRDKSKKLHVRWVDTEDILAMPFDIPVIGYNNDVVNTLRLWSARSTEEFDFRYFNEGDYERALYDKMYTENISRVLYPNDSISQGRELRLKQEYFFTAASMADIIRRFKMHNTDFAEFPKKVAVQLNDTHPTLAIVELMRILIDEEDLEWEQAWDIVTGTFAYTNHTVMPEAQETWAVSRLQALLPRHLELIYEINRRFLKEVAGRFPKDTSRQQRMSIIGESDGKRVRMACLCIVGSHSVNGVSQLHSQLIKETIFKDFYELWPQKFNNKTNGITQRRWLKKANLRLSKLINDSIGNKWVTNLYELKKLLPFRENNEFVKNWQQIKRANKMLLSDHIKKTAGVRIDIDSMFDVQVKRIHEYKRQVLFAFYIISQYLKVRNEPNIEVVPRTFLIGGKAAPGYFMAKLSVKFINNVAKIINKDKRVKGKFKVVFLENYCVSLAERVFPASDLSEQISTAGTEASGTGCMKFMLNGALTIGTLDGANIEMKEEVGDDNIFMFGLDAGQVAELKSKRYNPQEYINKSPALSEIFNLIKNNFFSPREHGIFEPLVNSLWNQDNFMVCADFEPYCKVQSQVSQEYKNRETWAKKAITNVALSGKFSGDRTISEYARQIWNVPYAWSG